MHRFLFLARFSSINEYPLEKLIQRCLSSSSFILVIDDTVALDCVLKSCCKLHAPFRSCTSKTDSVSSNRTHLGDWTGEYTFASFQVCSWKACMEGLTVTGEKRAAPHRQCCRKDPQTMRRSIGQKAAASSPEWCHPVWKRGAWPMVEL